ncbi:2769_t:CDS:1, partial [Cetraspora pellucida]
MINLSSIWTDAQLHVLIDYRKDNNNEYHELVCNQKGMFWKGIASKINIEFGTSYTGQQCKEKFNGLLRDYK